MPGLMKGELDGPTQLVQYNYVVADCSGHKFYAVVGSRGDFLPGKFEREQMRGWFILQWQPMTARQAADLLGYDPSGDTERLFDNEQKVLLRKRRE